MLINNSKWIEKTVSKEIQTTEKHMKNKYPVFLIWKSQIKIILRRVEMELSQQGVCLVYQSPGFDEVGHGIARLKPQFLGYGSRVNRSSRSSLTTQQVQGQSGMHETLAQKQNKKNHTDILPVSYLGG